jgi:hypothetical protein
MTTKALAAILTLERFGLDTVILTAIKDGLDEGFTVHRALFAKRSGLFKKALEREPDCKELTVEGDDVVLAGLYVEFLYTGRLPIGSNNATDEYAALCKLYTLATKLRDTVTKNAALDTIYTMAKEGDLPSSEHVGLVYGATLGPCGARRMLVDLYTQKATGREIMGHAFPGAFMFELATSMAVHRAVPNGIAWAHGGTSSHYHDE